MQASRTQPLKSVTLSLLLHAVIFLFIVFLYQHQKGETINQPRLDAHDQYVPAYTYSIPHTTPITRQTQPVTPSNQTKTINKQPVKKDVIALKPSSSMLLTSLNQLQQAFKDDIAPQESDEEPMYMIGDDSMPASPLMTLLGHALSRHFYYPEHSARLGIKGRVIIQFFLQPDGTYTDIKILSSSRDSELDHAALFAVNQAPAIPAAHDYLKQAKRFVIGFVFR